MKPSREVRSILLVRTSALGDVVHALPALAALRELYPRARIGWLVEPLGAELLAGHPLIDRLFVFDRSRWKREWRRPACWPGLVSGLRKLVREVRSERFDLVIDFQCNLRSSLWVLFSRGRRRLGFSRPDIAEWGGHLFTNQKAPPCPRGTHRVDKNLSLVRALGYRGDRPSATITPGAEDLAWARGVVEALPGSGPVITVHPAVSRFGEIKRWPADRFRALVDLARARLDARVLITWGPGEREVAEVLARPTLAPPLETPLRLAALAASSDAVVSADTAAFHIACALGVPAVGIYGPKDERVYGPPPGAPLARVVRSAVPCSPCRLRRCEHRVCMSMVFPEDVFDALKDVLERAARLRTARSEAAVPSS